jgi:hypothetical protein
MVFDFVSDTDALGAVRNPVDFLMLWFAVTHIKTFSAVEFSFFAAETAVSALEVLGDVFVVLLLVHELSR